MGKYWRCEKYLNEERWHWNGYVCERDAHDGDWVARRADVEVARSHMLQSVTDAAESDHANYTAWCESKEIK